MLVTPRILPPTVLYRADAEIEFEATTLRMAYESACGPIEFPLDVEDLIWSLLVKRDNLSLEDPEHLGYDQYGKRVVACTAGDHNGGVIRIDISIVDTPLFWFTLSHELGHWILHRYLLAAAYAKANGASGRMTTLQHHVGGGRQGKTPPEEWQANRFAVHLLMPESDVRACFAKLISREPIIYREKCRRVGRFAQQYPTRRDYTRMLAAADSPFDLRSRYRVSKEAMAIRIEELGLVVEEEPGDN